MPDVGTIVAMGSGVCALRLAGLVVPLADLPPFWTRALRSLPIALLTALVVSNRAGAASGEPDRILALAAAALVAWRSRRAWAAIASGLAVFWIARVIAGGG
jgi:branched-subunit amino acid transport protein